MGIPLRSSQASTIGLALATVLVAACSGGGSGPAVVVPSALPPPTTGAATASGTPTPSAAPASPAPTAAQTPPSAGNSASTFAPLATSGGTVTLPSDAGITGTASYAPNNAPASDTFGITTATTNVFGVSAPPSGTPVFYVGFVIGSGVDGFVTFANASPAPTLSLQGAPFVASSTYTAYAYQNGAPLSTPQSLGSPTADGRLVVASPFVTTVATAQVQYLIEIVRN